jgi:hypothetical protein
MGQLRSLISNIASFSNKHKLTDKALRYAARTVVPAMGKVVANYVMS